MLSPDRLSRIIGLIYDAAVDPAAYLPALDAVGSELRFCNGVLDMWTDDFRSLLAIASGISEPWLSMQPRYQDDIVAVWGGPERIAAYPREEPILQSRAVHPDITRANRY